MFLNNLDARIRTCNSMIKRQTRGERAILLSKRFPLLPSMCAKIPKFLLGKNALTTQSLHLKCGIFATPSLLTFNFLEKIFHC